MASSSIESAEWNRIIDQQSRNTDDKQAPRQSKFKWVYFPTQLILTHLKKTLHTTLELMHSWFLQSRQSILRTPEAIISWENSQLTPKRFRARRVPQWYENIFAIRADIEEINKIKFWSKKDCGQPWYDSKKFESSQFKFIIIINVHMSFKPNMQELSEISSLKALTSPASRLCAATHESQETSFNFVIKFTSQIIQNTSGTTRNVCQRCRTRCLMQMNKYSMI